MKKLLKILGITLFTIILLLIAVPFLFQNQIKDSLKYYINNNLNANVDFSDVNLSLLRSFPQANVVIDDLKITNLQPFEGETLTTAASISIDMPVMELFKKPSDEPIVVNSIEIDEAHITIKTDKLGNDNYDILMQDDSRGENNKSNSFKFDLEKYSITNSVVSYLDESSDILLHITELNHSGQGIFSADVSNLDTKSEANVSISIDGKEYLRNNSVQLNALIDLDLNEDKYTFKENNGYINQLPIEFEGFVKLLEDGQEIEISFKNTGSSFKDFLALIPKEYSKEIENVKTTGNFYVNGKIKGLLTDKTIPSLDIAIESNNSSFKYPDLPKSVENITINANIKNDSGKSYDTYIKINTLEFNIAQDNFSSSAILKNLTTNLLVNANIDGTLNLANITKAYPIELENELSGILKGKLNTIFDLNSIETNSYQRTKNNGNITVTDFIFSSDDVINPINILKADIQFNPGTVNLKSFEAATGKSDIKATGTIYNFLGFLLSDKNLQGNFKVNSNTFAVSDFMVEAVTKSNEQTPKESLKIPAFLDCSINARANTVLYDNLTLKDLKGDLIIKDEQAKLLNMSSRIFDGNINLNGLVNTQTETPTFDINLDVDRFNISQSFNDLDLFKNLAPIANSIQGKLNSTLYMSGNLTSDFTPDLKSLTGNAFAELITSSFKPKNEALFNQLKTALSFVDFNKLDLKDVKTNLTFENGIVNVKPINLKYDDIAIVVHGSHGFDKSMNYRAVFDVPAKYLGTEVNNLIANIDEHAVKNATIPVTATIGGTLTKPNVSTDLTSGITNLTKQLIEVQKQKLINKGKDQLKEVIGDILGNKTNDTDSTEERNDPVKNVLNDITKGNQTQEDTPSSGSTNPTKDVLGNVLMEKKKKKRDTIN